MDEKKDFVWDKVNLRSLLESLSITPTVMSVKDYLQRLPVPLIYQLVTVNPTNNDTSVVRRSEY